MFHTINEKISKPIGNKNKGFQMLKKMGYKEGEKLGQNDNGIKEPLLPNTANSKREGIGMAHQKKRTSGSINIINQQTKHYSDSNLLSALHYKKINRCKTSIVKSLKLLSNLIEIKFPELTGKYCTKRQVLQAQADTNKELEEFVDNMMLMKEILEKESIAQIEIELYFDYLNLTLEKFQNINIKENLILKLKEKLQSKQHNEKTICLDIIQCFNSIEEFLLQFNENIINFINKNMYYCTYCYTQYPDLQEFLGSCAKCDYKDDDE